MYYKDANDLEFGGRHVYLQLKYKVTGKKILGENFCDRMMQGLGFKVSQDDSKPINIFVARHHWTCKKISWTTNNKNKRMTVLSSNENQEVNTYPDDMQFMVGDDNGRNFYISKQHI